MKIEINESSYGFYINIQPETIAEQNKLLRMAINTKKEAASIHTSFSNNESNCSISLKKVGLMKTVTGISSNNRK